MRADFRQPTAMLSKSKSKVPQILLGCALSLVLLIYVFSLVDWREVMLHIWSVNLWICVPSVLIIFVHYCLRTQRWRYLLVEGDKIPFIILFDSIMIGNFATYILPLRVGEFVRPLFLSRHSNHSFSTAFVSVVVERFFDLILVLFTFALLIPYLSGLPAWVETGAYMLSALAIAIFVFLVLAAVIPTQLEQLITRIVSPLPMALREMIAKFLKDLLAGAMILRRGGNLLWVIVYTLLVWVSCYALFYAFLYFFEVDQNILLAVTVSVVIALAVAAPSAPGFLGVYQAACLAAFAIFGISSEVAVAYSIVTHIFQYLLLVAYGIFVLFKYSLHFSDISGKEIAS